MSPEEIPQELVDILDKMAGKQHSREGKVINCLAEILTRYEHIRTDYDGKRLDANQHTSTQR